MLNFSSKKISFKELLVFNKQKAKKIYKYLEKKFFSLEIINPKIRELLKDDKVLEELNKMLPEDSQLYRKKDLYFGDIGIVSDTVIDTFSRWNYTTTVKYKHYRYAVLRKFNDRECEDYKRFKDYSYDISSVYNWITQNLSVEKTEGYNIHKGDLFLGKTIPAGLYFENDLVTLEQIKNFEKEINKKQIKHQLEK